jgi:two-component system CheB/CheR fusion protein
MHDSGPAESVAERRLGTVDKSFYLIGVGASAGGLDALKQLITQIPRDFPHSLVIVQHISPDYKSLMSEILGRETSLPVLEVTDNMEVERGRIYLIPPRSNIVIQGTKNDSNHRPTGNAKSVFKGLRFSLVDPVPRPAMNLPIDIFFNSLAEAVDDRGVAIILSGTGTDGSRGLRAVKDREGFVMVQDPVTAAFDGMPRAAIATGIVDLVVGPDAMIGEMMRYFEMRASGIISVASVFVEADAEFAELMSMVSEKAEIDFRMYKEPTLKRRIARRMALAGHGTVGSYLKFIRNNSTELNVLHREFLVGVTNFFRDLPVWKAVEDAVLAELFAHGDPEEPLRIWSVGCSTGEEPYTLAMILERYRLAHDIGRDFRIYATDVNENAILAAKEGIYPDSVREEIPAEYIDPDYLTFQAGTFSVSPAIRQRVIFAVHNVIEDPPYTRTDLVVCRNLLIYLSPDVQAKIMTQFSFSLRKGGILVLGAAEMPGQHAAMFEAAVGRFRIYRNTRRIEAGYSRAANFDINPGEHLPRSRRVADRSSVNERDILNLLVGTLEETGSCLAIVDAGGKLIRSHGKPDRLLRLPREGFTPNLLELVDERLRSAVAVALRSAELNGASRKENIRLADGEDQYLADVSCRRISWEQHNIAFAVILRIREVPRTQHAALSRPERMETDDNQALKTYIESLEGEIKSLQDMLSATAEDLGAANEELQTTNEELIASNEELQANNEETQSINEELHTVNAENFSKIAELEAATADINNLLATADVGIVVLGDDMRIRRFSEGIRTYVDLEQVDVGRPITAFSFSLEQDSFARLLDDLKLVVETGEESSRELRRTDGGWTLCRTRPFRDPLGNPQGVVVSLSEITTVKLLQDEVKRQRDRLEGLLESEAAGYWDWNIPKNTVYMSPRFKSMLGYREDGIPNTREAWLKHVHPDDLADMLRKCESHIQSQGKIPYDNELRYIHKDGSIVWVLSRGRVVEWSEDWKPIRMMGVQIDITPLREREEAVRVDEVRRRAEEVKRFAFIAAHDLLQPVISIESAVSMLLQRLPRTDDDDLAAVKSYLLSATDRLRGRIKGILAYSRLQEHALELEPLDLRSIVEGCLADLNVEETDAKVEVGPLPAAKGSPSLVGQVIQNLLDNATKYRRPGARCRVSITGEERPDRTVAIRVADNGIGIEPKYRQKVFELFGRLHGDEEFKGEGIGLALCERIVSLHGGAIHVEDGIDGGAAFVFTLPAG